MESHSGFHSLREETAASLPVTGDLPDWLRGSLIRNGPGAFSFPDGSAVDHWFDGLAMLYRFTFDPDGSAGRSDGGAVHYRNRFLRTDAYEAARTGEFEGGFATGETTLRSRLAGFLTAPYDNANIVAERVGDRYLALTESPRGVGFVQYWEDFESLRAYARDSDRLHLGAWGEYAERADEGAVGIWHETYRVDADGYETVYNNGPPRGLGVAAGTDLVAASGRRRSAAGRLDGEADSPPVEP